MARHASGLICAILAASGPVFAAARTVKPSAAVLGVAAAPDVPPGDVRALEPDRIERALVDAARRVFSPLIDPERVKTTLRDGYGPATQCGENTCLAGLAEKLDVDRVVASQLVRSDAGVAVRLLVFDRATGAIERVILEADQRPFSAHIHGAASSLFKKTATGLARLKVTANVSKAQVVLGDWVLGSVPLERLVPAGRYRLRVGGGIWKIDEQEVSLAPGTTKEVEAFLVVRPFEEAEPPQPAPDERSPGPSEKAVEVAQPTSEPARPPAEAKPHPTGSAQPAAEEHSKPQDAPVAGRLRPSVGDADFDWEDRDQGPSVFTRAGFYVSMLGAASASVGLYFGQRAKAAERRAFEAGADGVLGITRVEARQAHRDAAMANVLVGVGATAVAGGLLWLFYESDGGGVR